MSYRRPQGLALLSGTLGSLASCFGKGAFGDSQTAIVLGTHADPSLVVRLLCSDTQGKCPWILLLVSRGLCLLAMIACNVLMLGSFVQGMQESGSVAGTALTNAANFTVSAFMGWLLFQEEYSSMWWCGFVMVLVGTVLLSDVRATDGKEPIKDD